MFTRESLKALTRAPDAPCISIYMPTHRHFPDNEQDPIRFKNLVREVEESLAQKYKGRDVRPLLEPMHRLLEDSEFWNHAQDGLCVLGAPGYFEAVKLQRTVKEIAVVAESFHIKPLIRKVQSADGYEVLCLTRTSAKLWEGNRFALDSVELSDVPATLTDALGSETTKAERTMHQAGGMTIQHGLGSKKDEVDKDTERYFRAVDRAVQSSVSNKSGLPLVLVALPEHQAVFRELSRNNLLLERGVEKDPESMTAESLRDQVWKCVEPYYLARLAKMKEDFGTAAAHENGTGDLSDAARAAVSGRVMTLLVESDRVLPGRIDEAGGTTEGTLSDPKVGDMLDDLAEMVLRTGGEVVSVPKERMPTSTGLAAIFRF